jgi:hypothetical protein
MFKSFEFQVTVLDARIKRILGVPMFIHIAPSSNMFRRLFEIIFALSPG